MTREQCGDCVAELSAAGVDQIRRALETVINGAKQSEQAPKLMIMALSGAGDGKGSTSLFQLAKLVSHRIQYGIRTGPVEPLGLHQKQHAAQLPNAPLQAIVYRPRRGKVGRVSVDTIALCGKRFGSRLGGNVPHGARRSMDRGRGAAHVRSGSGNPGAFITIAMTLA
jgi:hypothetical protein